MTVLTTIEGWKTYYNDHGLCLMLWSVSNKDFLKRSVSFPTTLWKLKLCQLSSQSVSIWRVTNSNKIWPFSLQNTIYTHAHILRLTHCTATCCNFNIIQILLSPSVPRHKDRVKQSTNTKSIRNTFSWRWNCFIFIKQLSFTNWQNKRAIIVNTKSQHKALHLNRDS